MNLTPTYKRTVDTPKGRGLFIKEYHGMNGRKYILVRFYPPQYITNAKGKKMPNPNSGHYTDHSFLHSLCIINKRNTWFSDLYRKLVKRFNNLP